MNVIALDPETGGLTPWVNVLCLNGVNCGLRAALHSLLWMTRIEKKGVRP